MQPQIQQRSKKSFERSTIMATGGLLALSSGRGQQPEPDLKLFIRDVQDNKKRPLQVRSWSTIKDIKDQLRQKLQVPPSSIRLYFGPLLTSGRELPNHRTLHDVGIYRSGETLLLDIKNSTTTTPMSPFRSTSRSEVTADVKISSSVLDMTPKYLQSLVAQARWGLMYGIKPELVLDGSGGTYMLHDVRKSPVAVFKPSDEEPYAENNPRGYLQTGDSSMELRKGVAPGEACIREVAAYLLDKDNFAGVPQTTLVEARHPTFNTNGLRLNVSQGGASIGAHSISPNSPTAPALVDKPGSFQEFVKCECTIDDMSPSKISVKEVHKIAILDIRIMNADRNAANLLVRRKRDNSLELVPIDHGFCLRSVCDVSWMDWCWLDWAQLKEPLCQEHKDYIMNLDIEADALLLREHLNICEQAVDYFRASSALLKAGVSAGLTLYDIAVLCCRNDNLAEVPSMMEKLFDMASDLAHVAVANERYHHSAASRALVEQLLPSSSVSWVNSPMVAASRQMSRKFGRSVSNAEFASTSSSISSKTVPDITIDEEISKEVNEDLPEDTPAAFSEDAPGMAQSSVSDASSDVDDDANDACSQWAAELIANVESRQNLQVSPTRPSRACSVGSEDNSSACSLLSSSPHGFWTVPPGSAERIQADDDGSIQWSPRSVSRASPAPTDIDSPPFMLDDCFSTPAIQRVTFAPIASPVSFIPPVSVDVTNIENELETITLEPSHPILPQPTTGLTMKRSKSYTAMPSSGHSRRSSGTSTSHRGPDKSTGRYAQYKEYFHNFIDLVIVRETTAALHHSKHASL